MKGPAVLVKTEGTEPFRMTPPSTHFGHLSPPGGRIGLPGGLEFSARSLVFARRISRIGTVVVSRCRFQVRMDDCKFFSLRIEIGRQTQVVGKAQTLAYENARLLDGSSAVGKDPTAEEVTPIGILLVVKGTCDGNEDISRVGVGMVVVGCVSIVDLLAGRSRARRVYGY